MNNQISYLTLYYLFFPFFIDILRLNHY